VVSYLQIFCTKCHMYLSFPLCVLHVLSISYFSNSFPYNIWWTVKVMELHIIWFCPPSCYFLSLGSNWSPQHLLQNALNVSFLPFGERPSSIFIYLLTYLLTYSLTPWCKIFFEKLIVTQLVKQQPAFFMEHEGSSTCSQKPATGPYPDSPESSSPHRSLSL
jgi:hypothetical protein